MNIKRVVSQRNVERVRAWSLVCVALLLAAGWVSAARAATLEKPSFKALDVFDLQWVADPQIAPDGKTIAFQRMSMDIKTDRVKSVLWLIDSDGKHGRPLTSAATSSKARWSPDGTRIAYLSTASDGSPQLFIYWMHGNVSTAVSNLTETPSSLAWSPDGRWLAFTMAVPAEHKPMKVDLPEAPKNATWAAPPKFIDRTVFRVDGEGYLPNSYNQVFLIGADGGAAHQLTHGDFDHSGTPSFSADGDNIYIAANRRADAEYERADGEIYRVDLADDSIHAITDRRGPDLNPVVSPDGKHIAYLGFDDKHLGYQAIQLYVMDLDGAHVRSLTATLDRDASLPQWSGDSKSVYFQYEDHAVIRVANVDLAGKRRDVLSGVGGADVTRPYSGGSYTVARQGRIAFMRAAALAPPALAVATSARDVVALTSFSSTLLESRSLGMVEEVNFPSALDAKPLQGWIVKPPGFDPQKKYPFLLEIHGGPFATYAANFAAEIQLYAAAGYVVLYMNPRGSVSYGSDFANQIDRDYPDKDFNDLMSGVDWVLGRGYVDPQRLFVTGGSGGGVLTAWIVGHTDRFRAAVVVKPVINWASFVLTADMVNYFYRYWFDAYPWDDVMGYWKRSPLAYVGNVKTPTMLMTGEMDYRTPSSEAEQFYAALKLRKVDTALVRVPNASHDISARPSLLIDKAAYVLAWLQAHDVKSP